MWHVLRTEPLPNELDRKTEWAQWAVVVGVWALGIYDVAVLADRPYRRVGVSQSRIAWRRFRRNRLAMAGLAIMAILYWVTLLAPFLAPFDPNFQGDIVLNRYLPPTAEHLFGTDKFGRDIFSRVLYGARISLTIGLLFKFNFNF